MTNEPMEMLVFQDSEGHYYVIPRQAWEDARVPRERHQELESLIAKGGATAPRAKKVADLPPRQTAGVRGGATSLQTVGTFQVASPVKPGTVGGSWDANVSGG